MTRTECIPPNPNHNVGNHPLINSDQLDQYYSKPKDSRPVSPSPLDGASFRKGLENVIDYLQNQYRRNCKAATIRSAAEAIRCFLAFLKEHAIGKLEDIRRQHIGAFVEHEQDHQFGVEQNLLRSNGRRIDPYCFRSKVMSLAYRCRDRLAR